MKVSTRLFAVMGPAAGGGALSRWRRSSQCGNLEAGFKVESLCWAYMIAAELWEVLERCLIDLGAAAPAGSSLLKTPASTFPRLKPQAATPLWRLDRRLLQAPARPSSTAVAPLLISPDLQHYVLALADGFSAERLPCDDREGRHRARGDWLLTAQSTERPNAELRLSRRISVYSESSTRLISASHTRAIQFATRQPAARVVAAPGLSAHPLEARPKSSTHERPDRVGLPPNRAKPKLLVIAHHPTNSSTCHMDPAPPPVGTFNGAGAYSAGESVGAGAAASPGASKGRKPSQRPTLACSECTRRSECSSLGPR